jgi:LAO/AO transport system kinase
MSELRDLARRAARLDTHAVARLVSVFQDRRAQAPEWRAEVMDELDALGDRTASAPVIGITGTPGSGKSSLLGRLAVDLLREDPDLSVAVLAVDPSSHLSGGALLGDRTRLNAGATDHRLYFRSEASDTELGGLSPTSFQVCRLLTRLFGAVIVETVGIGQSEADVRRLAEHVFLVIAPLGGDEVQFLKAGIIEIPDAFIINKCDEPAAAISHRQLKSSLWMARPFDADELPVFLTSAKTGEGLDALREAIAQRIATGDGGDVATRDAHFLERWVRDEWGRRGVMFLREELGGAGEWLGASGGFDAAQAAFSERVLARTAQAR